MTVRSVFRYEVPVDDAWHTVELPGEIRHVASRRRGVVELWADTDGPPTARRLRAYGTGHPVPAGVVYRGTALDGPLVWHLWEQP